jgi:uncharacterized delta-60 repeat protein/uncharacterized repeat protein (TIGR01451 family)
MRKTRRQLFLSVWSRAFQTGVLALLGVAASVLAQPTNDNFANAVVISGLVGQVTGNNSNATMEAGEPPIVTTVVGGASVGASVWYQWTAPSSGNVTFDTIASTPNGNGATTNFDTVLVVYIGTSVNSLTEIGADDDSGGNLKSSLTFTAVQGTTYYIAVCGYNYPPPRQGDIALSWNAQGADSSGQFRLTSSAFEFSQNESSAALDPRAAMMYTAGGRVSVTRVRGATGRVLVNYTIANSFYTNIYTTNFFGSNVFSTLTDSNGVSQGFTNTFYTNVTVRLQYENYRNGYFYKSIFVPSGWTSTFTNDNGTIFGVTSNGILNSNLVNCAFAELSTTNRTTDPSGNTNTVIMTMFCTNIFYTNYVPTGNTFSNTLVFADYQMKRDILVPAQFAGTDPNLNGYVEVRLNSAQLDTNEDQTLPSPSIQTNRSFAPVTFLSPNIDPVNYGPTNTIFNFERATLRCTEDVHGPSILTPTHVARVGVTRSGTNFTAGASVRYVIDTSQVSGDLNSFPLQAGSDYATPSDAIGYSANVDFTNVSGTLTWGANDSATKFIDIPINDDDVVEFNEDFQVIFDPRPGNGPSGGVEGQISSCIVTILADDELSISPTNTARDYMTGEQPAGAVDRSYNPDNWVTTLPPFNLHPGANGTVYSVAMQPDGKAVIGGDFTSYNTTNRNRIARIKYNGENDSTFNPGSGANGFVTSVLVEPAGTIVVGGGFTSINGTLRNRLARLNANGLLDTTTFNTTLGADGTIWSMVLQADGKIVIGGEFTSINGTNRAFVARLNPDGGLDTTFDPGPGPDSIVNSLAVQPDGKVIIGGDFTSVDGVGRSYIARLNPDGSLDTSFDPGFGADDIIYAVALQSDGRILLGGAFTEVGLLGGRGLARLNGDGSVDTSFDVGIGTDDIVYSLGLQPDQKILVGGIFKSINQTRRVSFARLLASGAVDSSFMDTAYNQFAGFINAYFNLAIAPPNPIYTMAVQPDGNIVVGGSFSRIGGGFARDDVRQRNNLARLVGNSTPGPGTINLAYSSYSADATTPQFFITLSRDNGTLGPAAATLQALPLPPGPGSATYGTDYVFTASTPTWGVSWPGTWMLSDGLSGPNNDEVDIQSPTPQHYYGYNNVLINVISNSNPDVSLNLALTQPKTMDTFFLGGVSSASAQGVVNLPTVEGENIPLGVALGRSLAPLTILHNNQHPGVIGFSSAVFTTNENSGNAVITVARTGGTDGTVTVKYSTSTGGTAHAGVDYTAKNGTLTFFSGQTSQTFTVPLINNSSAQADRTVGLTLFNITGGATLGNTNGTLVIVDDDFAPGHVSFSVGTNGISEDISPATITVSRLGGSVGVVSITVSTRDGTATNGVNYAGSTNVLTWNNGDVAAKTISIPIFDDGIVSSNLAFNLRLSNPTANGTNQPLVLNGLFTNAVVVITNVDSIGKVAFSAATYSFNENGGQALIPIVRTGGSAQTIMVNFSTVNGTAFAGIDYVPTNGSLVFAPGEVGKTIRVPVIDNGLQELPRFLTLTLSNSVPANALGSPSVTMLNIVDDESFNQPPGQPDTSYSTLAGFDNSVFSLALQADGSLLAGGDFTFANGVPRNRIARLKPDGTLDLKFSSYFSSYGADATIRSIAVQSDARILIGGFFTNFNSVVMNRIARLNLDGTLDSSFNPGSGGNAPVYAVAESIIGGQRTVIVGGAFTLLNGANRNAIARLLNSGAVDTTFNPGSGANGTVYAVAVQPDGKVIIGGDFSSVNNTPLNHIARLNTDGSVDASFNPGTGASDSVRAIALQLDGRILIGGLFTNVNGTALNRIARLRANGSLDSTFNPGLGANDNVHTIALQTDQRILLGGDFTRCSGVTRSRITRLFPDGSVDPTINFGTGADGAVESMVLQTDGNIVLAGGFTSYNDQPHPHLARVYGGSVAGSGSFEFGSATYQVTETGSNVVTTVRRKGGTSGPNPDGSGSVFIQFATSNGTAVAGVNFGTVVTNLNFPSGEVLQTVSIPIFDDGTITPDLMFGLALLNPTPPSQIGNQPFATVTIVNSDSGVSFSTGSYSVAKNTPNGVATIGIIRQGSTNGTCSVVFMTTTNGSAALGIDYQAVSNLVTFAPGVVSNNVTVPVINNGLPEGNRTVTMILTNAILLETNGANFLLLPPSQATLTIIDTVTAPGQLMFSQTNYTFIEGNSNALITIVRTNGSSGTVSASYRTVQGSALPGINYTTASGSVTFANGETAKTFNVPMLENGIAQGPVTLSLVLSNATGGATLLQPTNVPMTILDNDTGIAFSAAAYVANETNSSVTLNVWRLNTTNGTVQVSYATTNGTALAGTNYTATSGTLTFNPGETNKSVIIPLLHDPRATSNITFTVSLSNPSAGTQLMFPNSASVVLLDAEAGIGFTNSTFGVLKNATNAILTVFCSNPNVEPISVSYSSADGSAVAGVDYVAVNGVLTFTNGSVTNYIIVPIINNSLIEGDRTFTVSLSNPTAPGLLVSPSTASVTITDINSGFSFSSPAYTVLKGGDATITVQRTGYTNSFASINYATQDGTGTNGVDYNGVSGTFVFTNGETIKTFTVHAIDSTVVKPDKTVLVQLSNPVGTNAVLVSPSAAVLTIHDNSGSLILPAGVALISETGGIANGVIDPGETVRMRFALRNGGGTNTVNVLATLLATNGVSSPNPSTAQSYGALLVNGPSAFREFTFTASGTNGQPIIATFQLQDGPLNLGTATFTFIMGTLTASFTNPAAITINDNTTASPYAATINVANVGGALNKATVSFNKVNHSWASDVDALLVSPAGLKSLLMANAGGSFGMNNVTLTFDDNAASLLPQGTQITSGTNKPTTYTPVAIFPSPAPAGPYSTNLAAFNSSNPNGVWSLFIIDDTSGNSGIISNGWTLNLSTASPILSSADLVASVSASAGSVVVSNNLTYTVSVTNYGPGSATGVMITNTIPATATLLSSNASQGSVTVAGTQVVWNAGTLATNAGATLTLTIRANSVGSITNAVVASANELDPNTVNNSGSVAATVVAATADVSLSMIGTPNPVLLGSNVTYTLTISNAGPAAATAVSITNTLPPGATLISTLPANSYVKVGDVLTFTNLGNIVSGGQLSATIVIKPGFGGTITNIATAASSVSDPFKLNNSASVKIVVDTIQLGIFPIGGNIVITWPTNYTSGYLLEGATNLNAPIIWSTNGIPSSVISNGQYRITIGIGTGNKYFRLRGP